MAVGRGRDLNGEVGAGRLPVTPRCSPRIRNESGTFPEACDLVDATEGAAKAGRGRAGYEGGKRGDWPGAVLTAAAAATPAGWL